jgi:predicted RNase H-like nuclease (RuvC/YqgF family)
MATNYDDDDFLDEDNEPQDVVKQLRKVNRTLEKRLKELETEANTLKSQTRQRTVKDVLAAKGVNPKVAAFIPHDIEVTEEAVSNWLTEYGDVFGVTTPEAPEGAKAQNQDPVLQAQKRINDVVSTGTPPGVDEDTMSKILNAKSADDLNTILGVSVY